MRPLHALTLAALSAGALSDTSSAQSCDLTTIFTSNGGGTAGGVVYFNLVVNTPIVISSFEVNTSTAVGTPIGLQVWTTPNAYNGQIATPGVWTQVAQDAGTGMSAGRDVPSPIPLQVPLVLFGGQYGVALVGVGFAHRFTIGNGANQSYSNSCITLNAGAASNAPFTSGFFTPRVWNGTIRATAAAGLHADFTAANPSGPTPHTVSFADASLTSAPGGITSWAWDLDGNGTIDSNAQNPSFTYATCGRYDVTLTVNDGVNAPSTLTKSDFVVADPQLLIAADFTWAPSAVPLTMAFTDTSTGSPTAWSWDLNGDTVPDSLAQNPTWAYPATGQYTVTLVASNACGTDTEQKQISVIVNDDCTGAIPVTAGLSPTYSNDGATTSSAWPCGNGGSDVWFVYRPPCAGTLLVHTCTGTTYDSTLEVFSGNCAALVSIACNDDTCGLSSSLTFPVGGNQSYYIRVGGYNAVTGNFQLTVVFNSTGNGSFATVFPACGGANLATTGAPNLGMTIDFSITPTNGLAFVMIGSLPLGVPICAGGCVLGQNMDVVLPGPTFSATVPCLSILRGGQIYFQGAVLGVPGGCAAGAPALLVTTNTVRTTIG